MWPTGSPHISLFWWSVFALKLINHTVLFTGIPTDEEQATGLEKVIMKAMKQGEVRQHTDAQEFWHHVLQKHEKRSLKKTALEKEERDADSS